RRAASHRTTRAYRFKLPDRCNGSPPKMRPKRGCCGLRFDHRCACQLPGNQTDGLPAPPPIACGASKKPNETKLRSAWRTNNRPTLHFGDNSLLDGHLGASFFQLLLGLLGIFFRDTFLDLARSAFDQVLGFLQTEVRQCADHLDD